MAGGVCARLAAGFPDAEPKVWLALGPRCVKRPSLPVWPGQRLRLELETAWATPPEAQRKRAVL